MDYRSAFQISAAGMGLEKLRLDTAALNLANMHSALAADGSGFKPLRVVNQPVAPGFGSWMDLQLHDAFAGAQGAAVVPAEVAPRKVHDPGHPNADARGDVSYPGVDHMAEMLNVMNALRAYEANVAAFGAAKSMAGHALEIGGQS